ncbi:MAG: tRNA (adenosine(37)-N6)-threonylcarbamoyltransferase complex ATPase subunit type 1 TsaE [Chloroflexi bacterium]|nr:MAG: tRNA (adenosine(37)-N6)-threonylcarbamoyltransferase complex ATPase subunit type 1 TsaE [Chloroflexota bacterium]TME69183.1 MAG: tRNA (adenosine(37)-N6)-threonylcarbamoyltransferase complex ATPase subunit type 1 TsaE [Chloroflexota bacterium]TMG48522.1 MAG: tRNA (adenosine(37)-N6)-threonylcarbamoyltransferase complex ATPase subunit type 1 TsaE [Chloroflexota bacterium]
MRSGAKRSKPSASLWSSAEDSSARSHSFRSSATLGVASASPRPARCRRSGGSRSSPRSSARISASRFDSSSIVDASCASLPVGRHEMKTIDLVSHSSLHTERLGERLGRAARPNDVFALSGELGTGKTVLARGIAIGLGIDASDISSPTFIILREHGGGRLPFFHIDLYRLEGVDLANTGWEESLEAGGVTVIEWPDRAGPLLPDDRLEVKLEHIADTKRRIVVSATGPRSAEFVEELRASVISA